MSSILRCRQWAAKQRPTLKKAHTKAGRPKVKIDIFTASAVCLSVFFRVGDHPTLNKVRMLAKCREEIVDFPDIGRTSLWKLMKSIGFRYCKTRGNRKIMMENLTFWCGDIVLYVKCESFQLPVVLLSFSTKHGQMPTTVLVENGTAIHRRQATPFRNRRLLVRTNA